MADSPGRDFFISYTQVNRLWAEWIAVQLEQAGYTTLLQAWDFRPGSDFLHQMQQATSTAGRTIAVLSPAYFGSGFGEAEWRAAFFKDPTGELGLLVPVRVQPCEPPGLLASRVYIDLVDTDEPTAQRLLLSGIGESGARPTTASFPGAGEGAKRFPGQGPRVSNLPARNANFAGRGELLKQLHAGLQAQSAAAVVPIGALHGLGGVGKTQLALEFAHRFASDYDVAWWISADVPTLVTAALARLARRLGVEEIADQSEMVAQLFDLLRQQDRWLLVYDNAERPERLEGLLPPGGGGQVLATSRWLAWSRLATPFRVDVLGRGESIAFLSKRIGSGDHVGLDRLAKLLGDLPLALEEAAAYLEETQVGVSEYIALVEKRARELFGLDQPPTAEYGDRERVATTWSLSLDRVHQDAPAAEALLNLCAFLAPDIPRDLPREQPQVLPDALAQSVRDPLAYNKLIRAVGRYSLATVSPTALVVHRLTQAVIQARLGQEGERAWAGVAVGLLSLSFPHNVRELATWAACERLLPHILTVAGHAERLGMAGAAGSLLNGASIYLHERGQYMEARPLAERVLLATEAALGSADPEVAWRCDQLSRVLQELGDLAGAKVQSKRALAIGEATLGPDHPDVAGWRNTLGGVLVGLGDLDGAKLLFERALAIGVASLGPDHLNVAAVRNNLGGVLQGLGDLEGAKAQFERALEISEAVLGPDHPDVATTRGNLGVMLRSLGDLEGAKAQYERALEISEATLGPDHPTTVPTHGNLGVLLRDTGDLEGAWVQFERALEISEAVLGPDHPDVATDRGHLGGVLRDLGDLEGAKAQYERALEISMGALGPDHPDVAALRNNLGGVLAGLGDLEGARVQFERALEISEVTLDPDSLSVGILRRNLEKVLQALQEAPPEGPVSAF